MGLRQILKIAMPHATSRRFQKGKRNLNSMNNGGSVICLNCRIKLGNQHMCEARELITMSGNIIIHLANDDLVVSSEKVINHVEHGLICVI